MSILSKMNMKGRSLTSLLEISDIELLNFLDLADELKAKKKSGTAGDLLKQKNIALLFEKASTRTRCATAVAASDEGANTEYLGTSDIHLGKKESIADTALVLGRMFDGIMFRGFKHESVKILAEYAGVPVWNGLTDEVHPTQALADLMTVRENFGTLSGIKILYIGDGRNNVAISLMIGCAKTGTDFINCTPKELEPEKDLIEKVMNIAKKNGSKIEILNDPGNAVSGANAVYTDVWTSMGEEDQFQKRIELLKPYQVNMDLMKSTSNLDSGKVIFLHCLPAFHDNKTELTEEIGALEVTDDVFSARFSKVFDQAENRMHTIKAIMAATMVK